MKLISVKLPEALIQGMDELVKRGAYPSRSAIIRTALRDLLREELWSNDKSRGLSGRENYYMSDEE
ncbi:MAG: ribbon-helix-helix domain-containing protein [Aigarchaeota archaeon]|nr:ribbon-helix-helix domain-containing protein [Aigarchaeota archaeon]MDW8092690.1 ribbon-helix-helix domain-containing protein [Nitrososphaerota archaeon]